MTTLVGRMVHRHIKNEKSVCYICQPMILVALSPIVYVPCPSCCLEEEGMSTYVRMRILVGFFLMTCKKMAVQFLYDMRSIIKNDSCFLVAYLLSCKFLCWKGTDMSDYYWYACMLGHIQMTADKSHRLWILCSSFFPLKNKQKELSSC